MGLQKLKRQIEAGFKEPVYFLWAEDDFILWEAFERIKASVVAGDQGVALDVFDATDEEFSLAAVFEALASGGLFGSRTIVVIKRFDHIKAKRDIQSLVQYIKSPSDNTLIMLSRKDPPGDLKKSLNPEGVIDLNLRGRGALKYIRSMAKLKGLQIDEEVAQVLFDLTEKNFGRIYWELEKLSLAGYREVTPQAIEELVTGTEEFSAFNVADALLSGRKVSLMKQLGNIKDRTRPETFIGALNWKIRQAETQGKISHQTARRMYEVLLRTDISLRSSAGAYPVEIDLLRLLSD